MKTEAQVEEEIQEIVPFFLKSRSEDLISLGHFIENQNFLEIQKVAHTIKGIARPYGFPTLESISKKLEQHAKNKSLEDIQETISEMSTYLSQYT